MGKRGMTINNPELSIIIPLYNEEGNVPLLFEELSGVLDKLEYSYEVICIDDGSTDKTLEQLRDVYAEDKRWRIISFRRNFGQTAAMTAGFDAAEGKRIITIDADLQNDPNDIPKLLAKMDEGYDIVSGWRQDRKENYMKRRLPSMIANRIISSTTGVELHDYGCTLKVYDRVVVKNVELYGELHRFIPAIASWMGVRVAEVPVKDRPRRFGQSKYGIARTFRVILDLITVTFLLRYANKPLRFFGTWGAVMMFIGLSISGYLAFERLVLDMSIADRPVLLLGVLLIILGFNMISLGLIAEIVMRNYYNPQGKPTYMVRHQLDSVLEDAVSVTDPGTGLVTYPEGIRQSALPMMLAKRPNPALSTPTAQGPTPLPRAN